ncbi:PadR family transcriptional regulator [Limosilactobacillus gastricus]|mgnify:CR=1 FL=1|uniref:PadR family transcriptional regulator n=1 Tax=Limosilactobacillus gastricus TaxID=227942 RepID=UPI000313BA6E|nr:PadR family transcriptional regulator [Limosilactobacillus gastricus]
MNGRDVVLGILNGSDRTGYEINDILKTRLSYFYDGTYGMIYPTLRKLESEGKIEKHVVVQTDKPNKNVFSITLEGKKEFQKYLDTEFSQEVFKSDFLLHLFFGDSLNDEQIKNLIQKEIEYKQSKLDTLKKNNKEWETNGISKTQKITVAYGIAQYEAVIKVLNEALADYS